MNIRKINFTRLFGSILVGGGAFVIISSFLPIVKNEIEYGFRQTISVSKKEIVPVDRDFGIVIPKINANSKIIKNIDPFNPLEYQLALTKGVAHAKGSFLPGDPGNIFLFSHSSSDFLNAQLYNSIFYLLIKLEKGDEIDIYYNQKKFSYQVTEKKIVSSKDTNYLKSDTKEESLTLMTCWPPGTSLKRLIIQASSN